MARRCRRRIGAPSPTFKPAGQKRSEAASGVATDAPPRSSPIAPARTAAVPNATPDQTERWLEARKAEMLPTRYFHVTVTVPEELRDTLRSHQRDGYALLMKAAAEAIVELAHDRRFVGATVGVLAVLHTWTQQLHHHPHVHCLVTGGGVSDDGAVGARRVEPSCFPSRPWLSWCAASSGPHCARSVLTSSCPTPSGPSPGSSIARPGARASRPCSTISPATSFASPSPTPYRRPRRSGRHLPLQASQIQPLADQPHPRPGVHAPLPPARPAQGLAQGPLLRPVASLQARRTPPAPACCFCSTVSRTRVRPKERACRRARASRRTARLPLLRRRSSPVCPPTFPEAGPSTMTLKPVPRTNANRPRMPQARHQHFSPGAPDLQACEAKAVGCPPPPRPAQWRRRHYPEPSIAPPSASNTPIPI